MDDPTTHPTSDRFTSLSDRFRSLWTFYQFLGGVFKNLGSGPMPYTYDFQRLHGRMEEMIPKIGVKDDAAAVRELDQLERELDRIHRELSHIEKNFAPSTLRRFFDHIKRQDEKVLCALLKFYLLSSHFEQDTLDKLDILFTRLAEAPLEDDRVAQRDPGELLASFDRLSDFTGLVPLPPAEEAPLAEAIREIRKELKSIGDYTELVESRVYERYRRLKQRFGKAVLHPKILLEITATNIVAKNSFKDLFEAEEKKVIENTERIYEFERYLDHNPELANEDLKRKIEDFRRIRVRYDASRRLDNVKRDDITELTRAMHVVLAQFDPASKRPVTFDEARPSAEPISPSSGAVHSAQPGELDQSPELEDDGTPTERPPGASLSDVLPTDPLLNETLHKIMFALEIVVWDRLPNQIAEAPEISNLKLEPWEVATYRNLTDGSMEPGTGQWELERFFLQSAALRVKMEEERGEINRLEEANNPDRLYEVLECSAQSLERAREVDRRFQWFVDDMLFRGETQKLEQIIRSRFRFLHAYSGLWLDHERSGGLTPL